jgi:preprotein translocase subunit SecD
MKTLKYIFIAIFIFVAIGCSNKSESTSTITIETINANPANGVLTQSIDVITKRLQTLNSGEFEIKPISNKNQIQLILDKSWDLNTVKKLITKKGHLAFYETYNRAELKHLLNNDRKLFDLLQSDSNDSLVAVIGYINKAKIDEIDNYLSTLNSNIPCKFVWDSIFDRSKINLYALKPWSKNKHQLNSNDIEAFRTMQDKQKENIWINFNFKQNMISNWADFTRNNLNKTIAVTLDDVVVYAPTVQSEIKGGKCQITGSFSQNEISYILALLYSGELNMEFIVVQ